MKIWIASIFLFIFSFQVLPVKEVGKLLFKNALTEEIHETETEKEDADLKLKKGNEPNDFIHAPAISKDRTRYFGHCIDIALTDVDTPPRLFSPEVLTPPPNC